MASAAGSFLLLLFPALLYADYRTDELQCMSEADWLESSVAFIQNDGVSKCARCSYVVNGEDMPNHRVRNPLIITPEQYGLTTHIRMEKQQENDKFMWFILNMSNYTGDYGVIVNFQGPWIEDDLKYQSARLFVRTKQAPCMIAGQDYLNADSTPNTPSFGHELDIYLADGDFQGRYFDETSSAIISLGYNKSQTNGHTPFRLGNVYVGVEAVQQGDVAYDLTISIVPFVLTESVTLDLDLTSGEAHFFHLPLGDYDVVELRLQRFGYNISYPHWQTGNTGYNDYNLNGNFFIYKDRVPSEEVCLDDNGEMRTEAEGKPVCDGTSLKLGVINVTVDYFCTSVLEAGNYYIGVTADPQMFEQDPHFPEESPFYTTGPIARFSTGNPASAFNEQLDTAPDTLDFSTPDQAPTALRMPRGRYQLQLYRRTFEAGGIENNETREGCVSYGQWRYYNITTGGEGNATISVDIDSKVSGLYVDVDKQPTLESYKGVARPPISTISSSPCPLYRQVMWHVGVFLAPITLLDGVLYKEANATLFHIRVALEPSTLVSEDRIAPRAEGGLGYVCCNQVKFFVLHSVSQMESVDVQLNVTKGHVRILYVKHHHCPAYNDIVAGQCSPATSDVCLVDWLTEFDHYHGTEVSKTGASVAVPFGPQPWNYNPSTTLRRAGDWFIGIQAMPETSLLEGVATGQTSAYDSSAEFEFSVNLVPSPGQPFQYECDPLQHFCPKEFYHAGYEYSIANCNSPCMVGLLLSIAWFMLHW